MKFALSALCFAAALAIVAASADSGHFIPKAFYTLDSEGHKSDLHPINPHTAHYLRRMRRQVFTSASSSSSSSSTDGGPVFFTNQQVVSHSPGSIASRFGGTSSTGHVVQTTGVIDKDGRIHYKTQQGHF